MLNSTFIEISTSTIFLSVSVLFSVWSSGDCNDDADGTNDDDDDNDGDDDDDDLVIIWGRWGTLKWDDGNFRWKLWGRRRCRGGRCSVFLTMRCLNVAMFKRCDVFQFLTMQCLANVFGKTWTLMFRRMFDKIQNLMLTMHIKDVFQMIK